MNKAYCIKCKQKSDMIHIRESVLNNGRLAVTGTCSECGCGNYWESLRMRQNATSALFAEACAA